MIWPVAALAVVLLGFVVIYSSRLQARLLTASRDDAIRHVERT